MQKCSGSSSVISVPSNKEQESFYPRWLSMTEACKYASMSDKTLMRYVNGGDIKGSKKGGKWYIDRLSIDAFMLSEDVKVQEVLDRLQRRAS